MHRQVASWCARGASDRSMPRTRGEIPCVSSKRERFTRGSDVLKPASHTLATYPGQQRSSSNWAGSAAAHSGALHVCPANPGDHLRIHLAHARESDPEARCVMTVCAEPAAGVLTVETEAEIDSGPRRRLNPSERS